VTGPSYDELMEGASPDEEARLRRVHELLVTAGPPPELPPSLEEAPVIRPERERKRRPALTTVPRRRFGAVLVAAAGIAAAAFFVGYLAGNVGSSGKTSVVNIPMRPTAVAPQTAAAVIALEKNGSESNVPMTLTVSGLKKLPRGSYYELWLTREAKSGGRTTQKLLVSCGTFLQSSDRVEVKMNAPYTLDTHPGWVITRHVRGVMSQPIMLTT
jgi:anti-sigma-K factor RskA